MIAKMCAKFNSFNFHGCDLKSKVSLMEEGATKKGVVSLKRGNSFFGTKKAFGL